MFDWEKGFVFRSDQETFLNRDLIFLPM